MATNGEEAIGSMGTDTSLAVLSDRPRLLYDYFKQLFAQVTNPPLDAIREELVTSMESTIGPEGNLLDPRPESCRQIEHQVPGHRQRPAREAAARLRPGLPVDDAADAVRPDARTARASSARWSDLKGRASEAVEAGYNILILSDRGADRDRAPIPSLLATAGVHHHLVREGTRTRCALVVETGDAREVHHCALLLGYGAGAVNPYLAFETLDDMIRQGMLRGVTHEKAVKNYIKALNKGILKVMSKMGISTLQSYCGAQIFEAVGLDTRVRRQVLHAGRRRASAASASTSSPRKCASGTAARSRTWPARGPSSSRAASTSGGATASTTSSTRTRSSSCSTRRAAGSTRSSRSTRSSSTIRASAARRCAACSSCKPAATPVPIDEVEPVESIVKRFATGAMSYGSISQEAHETLAIAMNRLGGKSNTGEGGEDPARYMPDANGDSRRSAIKQVASARFGVTSEYLVNATTCRSRWRRAPSRARAASCPATRSIRGSRRSATRRRASG